MRSPALARWCDSQPERWLERDLKQSDKWVPCLIAALLPRSKEDHVEDVRDATTALYSRRRWPWLRSRVREDAGGAGTITRCAHDADRGVEVANCWRERLTCSAPGQRKHPPGIGVDLKSLHAKIGELTLENDFLSAALGKAGLLSAKR